jgi:Xaa-Pro aminopeptidase
MELGLDQRLMMPVAEYERLKEEHRGIEWVDAAPLLWRLRMIKSPAEVAAIREADRINGQALRKAFGRAKIGMTEKQIYALCVHALVEEGSLRPPHTQMTISSSARYRGRGMVTPFSGPTDEPLGRGDLLFIDSGAIVNGYWGEFNRMAVMGPPSPEQTRWHNIARGIVMGFIREILRPGIACEQAMQEAFALYDRAGLEPSQYQRYTGYPYFPLCHGLGLNSSELPLVRITDKTVIEPGMVFSVEAYVRGPDMQYGSEEDVVITASGCEVLSAPDPGLFVIGKG